MTPNELPQVNLQRRAIIYVRQSTGVQVQENLESQRRQYELADLARSHGFRDVVTIDADLGLSASGTTSRPGFESLVAQICRGIVGAVYCLEASRLARNGRDWHHLLEFCALAGAVVVDAEAMYNPSSPNDRLLLGLKGTMSEFELTLIRQRLVEGAMAKARRGELRVAVPVGYLWFRDSVIEIDPDRRVQDAIRTVFSLFDTLGSGRQVLLRMCDEGLLFPRPADPKGRNTSLPRQWGRPTYRHVISVLTHPIYAGTYAYGKSTSRTTMKNGRLSKSYGHDRPMEEWPILLKDNHPGYISWEQYEKNRAQLRKNAFAKAAGNAKSGRGGRALLSGLLRCRRCGRMLKVTYNGKATIRYHCRGGHAQHGLAPCIDLSAHRPDEAVARVMREVVQPMAVEAVVAAEEQGRHAGGERRRAQELELQQFTYEARLAERRYESVDPENRIVAAELETRWNNALALQRACEARLKRSSTKEPAPPNIEGLMTIAADLEAAWEAPSTTMQMKQRLVRTLIREIVVDVDDERREVVMTIHWHGGQHSELRVRKPRTGEHRRRTSAEAKIIIREFAGRASDEHIAATLNRMGLKTGQNNTWNGRRVGSYRRKHGIAGYESANKDGRCLTMLETAKALGSSCHFIRSLIQKGILPARQVMKEAPWQIQAVDLESPAVQSALAARRSGKRPCPVTPAEQKDLFSGTCRGDAQ